MSVNKNIKHPLDERDLKFIDNINMLCIISETCKGSHLRRAAPVS